MALFAIATVLAASLAPPLAGAAEQQVVAATNGETFSPGEVTIGVGDTVTVTRAAGGTFAHNSHYDDQPEGCPLNPTTSAWSCSRTFASVGDFTFRCDLHAAMQATVHVVSGGGATPGPNPGPSPGAPTGTPGSTVRTVPIQRLATLPPSHRCLPPEQLRFRLRRPSGTTIVEGRVFVAGKRVARRGRAGLTDPVLVRHLPTRRALVKVELIAADGSRLVGSRRYSVCAEY